MNGLDLYERFGVGFTIEGDTVTDGVTGFAGYYDSQEKLKAVIAHIEEAGHEVQYVQAAKNANYTPPEQFDIETLRRGTL